MISKSSGALSTAQAIGSNGGLLTFAQNCTVYDGGSSAGPMLVSCSTSDNGVHFSSPVAYGSSGMWVTITSSAVAPGVIHFK
jgi:hypothetical protein